MRSRRCKSRAQGHSLPRHQHGAALIIAMLVFALCAAMVVAMKSEFNRFFQRTANNLLDAQAQAYLRGGEDLAIMALQADYDQDQLNDPARDDLNEIWAQGDRAYPLDDGGWLTGSLEDLQGRFNLNTLLAAQSTAQRQSGKRFTAAQAQFIRLLQALGEPEVSQQEAIMITEAIHDWLDEDNVASADGAEDDYYYSREPAHRTGNRPMASVSELRAVAYMTPEIYQAIEPYVTVWPQDASSVKLNIHTAPLVVLRSINADKVLSPLSESEGESLFEYRKETGFVDKNDFVANVVFDGKGKDQMPEMKKLLGVTSSYFLLKAEVKVADRNLHLYSVLERGNRRVQALVRASGSL